MIGAIPAIRLSGRSSFFRPVTFIPGNPERNPVSDKIRFDHLFFTPTCGKETEKERNAHSLVLCTHYKDLHMLFTGDMGISEETYGEEPVSVLFFPE